MRFLAFCVVLVLLVSGLRLLSPDASEPKVAGIPPSVSPPQPVAASNRQNGEFTREQKLAIAAAVTAQVAGLEDYCPRYRLREAAMYKELFASGLTDNDFKSAEMSNLREQLIGIALTNLSSNPSQFCKSAWAEYGPNGSYRGQLLEEKP